MTAFPSILRPAATRIKKAISLRHYQASLENRIELAWAAGKQNVLAVSPTGSGKTVLFCSILSKHVGAAVAIAHRQELLSQLALTLNKHGIAHRIVAPDPVIRAIVDAELSAHGVTYFDPSADIGVAGVDTVERIDRGKNARRFDAWRKAVTLWVNDECFPAGTLIDGRPIESLEVGDYVTAFNESTGGFEKRKVVHLFKNIAPENMVTLTIGSHVLSCTLGHPFWTRRGWVPAVELTKDDEVLLDQLHAVPNRDNRNDRESALSISEDRTDILQSEMRLQTSGRTPDLARARNGKCSMLGMRNTRNCQRLDINALENPREGLLLSRLFGRLPVAGVLSHYDSHKCGARSFHPLGRASTLRGVAGENIKRCEGCRVQAENTRGQWATADRCRSTSIRNTGGVGLRASAEHKDRNATRRKWLPLSLQTGRGKLVAEDSNRSGRKKSSSSSANGCGSEKGSIFKWVRLASITIHERGDSRFPGGSAPDGFVYNIEVEGLHTYVANGVVVHNCAHVTAENKWGRAFAMFPGVKKGLGVTAWPGRSDGKGLGRHADGLFDHMELGPTMPELIEDGYSCPFKIWTVPHSVDYDAVPIGASGELVQAKLQAAEEGTQLVGNIVETYKQRVPGKRAICFLSSIKKSEETAAAFRAAGVPALALDGTSDRETRNSAAAKLASGEILVLTNADLYGEGNDIPAVEVVIMGTRTASFQRYLQWFGRMLRILLPDDQWQNFDAIGPEARRARIAASSKPFGILIDHAGNVIYHRGPPAGPHLVPTLDRVGKRSSGAGDSVPYRVCTNPGFELTSAPDDWAQWRLMGWKDADLFSSGHVIDRGIPCMTPYAATDRTCPTCGYMPVPASRKDPKHVDGDLQLLDDEALAALLGAKAEAQIDERALWDELCRKRLSHNIALKQCADHRRRVAQLGALGEAMGVWGGLWLQRGDSDSQMQRRFYSLFGYDVISAQALKRDEAEKLTAKIWTLLQLDGIVKPE